MNTNAYREALMIFDMFFSKLKDETGLPPSVEFCKDLTRCTIKLLIKEAHNTSSTIGRNNCSDREFWEAALIEVDNIA